MCRSGALANVSNWCHGAYSIAPELQSPTGDYAAGGPSFLRPEEPHVGEGAMLPRHALRLDLLGGEVGAVADENPSPCDRGRSLVRY
jgi:hypothetical protein